MLTWGHMQKPAGKEVDELDEKTPEERIEEIKTRDVAQRQEQYDVDEDTARGFTRTEMPKE